MTNNNKLIKLKMISSKEICDSLHLVHFGKDIKVDSYTTLEQVKKNSVVFLKNNSEKSIKKLKKHRFSLLVLPESMKDFDDIDRTCSYVFHQDTRKVFFDIIDKFFIKSLKPSIDPSAQISKLAEIGSNVFIGRNVIIDANSIIGDNSFIGAGSQIIGPCKIGTNASISNGVIIGEESLSIRYEKDMQYQNPQLGGVKIGKDTRIGIFSSISRGSIGDTILGDNILMGEYAHVGHNSVISSKSVLTIRSSICGSVTIEKPCWLGPHSLILNGVIVKEEIKLGSNSVLQTNVKKKGTYFGNPAKLLKF